MQRTIIRQAQDAAGLIGDSRVEEISPGGLSAASIDALDQIINEGDEALVASAADVGNRALNARRLGLITIRTAAEVTSLANEAVDWLHAGERTSAVNALNQARGLLDAVA